MLLQRNVSALLKKKQGLPLGHIYPRGLVIPNARVLSRYSLGTVVGAECLAKSNMSGVFLALVSRQPDEALS